MRPYEVMVIFDVGAEPPAIQAVVDRLLETIRANDGAPGHVDRWGRRPFAYEVRHRREGYYVVVELSGEPRTVAEIDRLLTLADEVLRFKVVRLPDKIAARLAAGGSGGGYGRPGTRGPAPRGHSGRGPGSDAPRTRETARATAGQDAMPGGTDGATSRDAEPADAEPADAEPADVPAAG